MNRHHVMMIVAVAAVVPAVYFGYQILFPTEFEEAQKNHPTIICVGKDCDQPENPPDESNQILPPPEQPAAPVPGSGVSGGGSSLSGSVIGEILDLGGLNEQCLTWLVDYCDSWEHALYNPNSLPNGNQTFPEAFPQCQQIQFFVDFGQPTQSDCQALYQNISGNNP